MNALVHVLLMKSRRVSAGIIDALLIVTTPLVEKNPAKTLAQRAPVVLSMTRVVVLAFAVALLHQIWRAGVAGWPDATLSMAVVLALPTVAALERVRPSDTIALARTLIGRFGQGGVREIANAYAAPSIAPSTAPSTAPSKFDDHRSDRI